VGAGSDHRGARRRAAGGDGRRLQLPPGRAGRGGSRGGRDARRRQPRLSPARNPALDDAPPAGRRPRARRGARDPVGLGGAIYQRFGYGLATLSGASRSRASGLPSHARRHPRGPSGWWISRRRWASSRRFTTGQGPGAGDACAQRDVVALGDAPRHRPCSWGKRDQVPRRLRRRRCRRGDGHLPGQARLGRARSEGHPCRDRGPGRDARANRDLWGWLLAWISSRPSAPFGRLYPIRSSCSWRSRDGWGSRSATGSGFVSWTSGRRWRRERTRGRACSSRGPRRILPVERRALAPRGRCGRARRRRADGRLPDVTLGAADLGATYLGTFTFSSWRASGASWRARLARSPGRQTVRGRPRALVRHDVLSSADVGRGRRGARCGCRVSRSRPGVPRS